MKISKITFEEILPKWKLLWPGKKNILPVNASVYLGGVDESILASNPSYFGCYDKEKLVGVISGYKSSVYQYRLRGVRVDEEHRGKGISTLLMEELEKQALSENCNMLWTMARKNSLFAYKNFGFVQVSEFFTEGVEFGPNCYMRKRLE